VSVATQEPPTGLRLTSAWALTVAVLAGAALALVSAIPMPRGPVDSGQALIVIGLSIVTGVAVGYLTRRRLALLLMPIAYMAAYELARIGLRGASVESIRFDSAYGIIAFATGRGLHGLLAVFPMMVGIGSGIGLARSDRSWSGRALGWAPRAVLQLAVVGLAVLVALPASTPPVLGADGRPVAGSIAELTTVRLRGTDQAIMIRGTSPENPVLLYLAGGPGQSDLAYSRALLEPLTADFVVVTWDQPGTGKSYAALDPTGELTLQRVVDDTIALATHLRDRFGQEKIYLLGESWGTTLGVLAVQQRPDLFHAYIGSGQMVSQRETDRIIWRDLLAYADARSDGELYDRVLTYGEPPYRDTPWANAFVMGYYDALAGDYTPPAAYVARGEASGAGPFGLFGSEYSFVEKANVLRGLIDTFSVLYPQIQGVDLRTDVPQLAVPVYLLDGEHELRARREPAREWFARLEAPRKRLITFANAGHAVGFEQADALRDLLVNEIVPAR
jgi:pimeloyl-ACP methyl ester carboxylesterase